MTKIVRIIFFGILILSPIFLYFQIQKQEKQQGEIIEYIPLPVAQISNEKKTPSKPAMIPKIALVFDDLGDSMKDLRNIAALNIPITIAIIPDLHFSKNIAQIAMRSGITVLVHLPLEPKDIKKARGNRCKFIERSQGKKNNLALLIHDLNSIKGAIGVNNHMGSFATEDKALMSLIMPELKARGLFFVDSQTSLDSIACQVAYDYKVPCVENQGFLDSINKQQTIEKRFKELYKKALEKGKIIIIAHPRQKTFKALNKLLPEYRKKIKFITIKDYFKTNE